MAGNEERRTIKIVVDTGGAPGLKALADQMGDLNKSVKKTSDIMGSFQNIFNSVIGFSIAGIGIKTLTGFSDEMQNLTNRIQVFTNDTSETGRVFDELTHAADRTKSSIADVAQIYTRLAASTKELKLSSNTLIAITEGLQNAFRLGGSNAKEAANATIQFSQAMALGVLRGQDLKSVLSQSSVLGDVLAKALGRTGAEGTRGALLKFAEAGGLTSSFVLKALIPALSGINEEAKKLTPTFEQSATKAVNAFTIAVAALNTELGLSSGFAKAVDFLIEKAGLLAIAALPLLATVLLGLVVPAVKALGVAFAFLTATPLGLAIVAFGVLAVALTAAFKNFDKLKSVVQDVGLVVEKFFLKMGVALSKFSNAFDDFLGMSRRRLDTTNSEKRIQEIELFQQKKASLNLAEEASENSKQKKLEDAAKKDAARLKAGNEAVVARSDLLAKLNREFESGTITVSQYYDKLETVDSLAARGLFVQGKKDLEQFHTELRKNDLSLWNRQLYDGTISLENYNRNVDSNKLETLNEKFAAGKIGIQEYDAELNKLSSKFSAGSAFSQGLQDTVNGIGSLGSAVAGAVTRTFSRLEDALVEFTKRGKINMNDFAQAVLDDLNRIIIRSQIIAPLAQGLLNAITPSPATASTGGYSRFGATPIAFNAKGGVYDQMTPFMFGKGGRLGVMGEAGPEAILPLKRGPDGSLGVQSGASNTVVNIVNNSGGQVEQSESVGPNGDKQIDIIIHAKVKEGFASGHYDKQLNSSYGIKRKGT